MKTRILVAYASRYHSTSEVAEAIGDVLRQSGAAVDVCRVQAVVDLKPYQAVVLGSATRMGKLLPEAVQFAQTHRRTLRAMPTAYFTVGVTMREDTPEHRRRAIQYLEPLRAVQPPVAPMGLFAGKVDYTKLEPMWRFLIGFDKNGELREGDWRNWEEIQAWAAALVPKLVHEV
jgi:menaquinone-dependent protoporphyrinogen oxidase